jgi:hypothetical protein
MQYSPARPAERFGEDIGCQPAATFGATLTASLP